MMRKNILKLVIVIIAVTCSVPAQNAASEVRIEAILQKMTLEEKIDALFLITT
jgi:hypothetical protein